LEWLDTTIEQEQKSSCTGKAAQTEKGPAWECAITHLQGSSAVWRRNTSGSSL